jgi:hypothetical protein
MGFIFEGLFGCSIALAAVYFLLGIHAFNRLKWLQSHSSAGLNTRKLFVMTLLLTAVLRCMSFASMILLDSERLHYQTDDGNGDGEGSTADFFEKSIIALFDFPDFSVISAFLLLIIVWAEAYLKSRRHWLSSMRFRRVWMLTYFIFNILLYSCQVALYSLLFLPSINEYVETSLIYLTITSFSFLLPIIWALGYLYLAIMVS